MAAPRYIDWDKQPLGKVIDTELACRLGVSPSAVGDARRARGIAAIGNTAKLGIDWDKQPLGIRTDREIADRLGVHLGVVWKVRTSRGIPLAPDRLVGTPEVRAEAVGLRRKGWTYRDIGEVYGVSETTVMRWLRKEGVA